MKSLRWYCISVVACVATVAHGQTDWNRIHQQNHAQAQRIQQQHMQQQQMLYQQQQQQLQGAQHGGMQRQSPAAPPPPPIPTVWVNSHVAVAWHGNSRNVWATWNQRTAELAQSIVLDACNATMGGGCTLAPTGHNGSIAIARDKAGMLWSAWGDTEKNVRSDVEKHCAEQKAECKVEAVFTGRPWREPANWGAFERKTIDETGINQKYAFPPESKISPPVPGTSRDKTANVASVTAPPLAALNIPGSKVVFTSTAGAWILVENPATDPMPCSVAYVQQDQVLTFIGPGGGGHRGIIAFYSPRIPSVPESKETTIVLKTDDPAIRPRAMHMASAASNSGTILVPTVMEQTIAGISDKMPVGVEIYGKEVFSINVEGGHTARNALQACMAKARK